jgi:hypothetical protein
MSTVNGGEWVTSRTGRPNPEKRRLAGPKCRSGHFGEGGNCFPVPNPGPSSPYPSHDTDHETPGPNIVRYDLTVRPDVRGIAVNANRQQVVCYKN